MTKEQIKTIILETAISAISGKKGITAQVKVDELVDAIHDAQHNWIPVSKQPPKLGKGVVCEWFMGYNSESEEIGPVSFSKISGFMDINITHWMHYPDKPTKNNV